MDKKLTRKRLSLNKKTVAHLGSLQLGDIKGGCTTRTIEYTSCELMTCPTGISPTVPKDSDGTCFTETGDYGT